MNPLSPLLLRAICSHTHTQLHILLTKPQLSTQTMNAMKLEDVIPLPLEFNEYAEATLDTLGEEARMTPTKLLKYKTVVCYTVLKALVVPLRSFRFIIFYLLKSNELLLLYRARGSTCPILSDHSYSYAMLVLCRFQCIYYRSSFPRFQVRKNSSPPCRCFLLHGDGLFLQHHYY